MKNNQINQIDFEVDEILSNQKQEFREFFNDLVIDSGPIPNVGCAKFVQDVNQSKFKSFRTINLLLTTLKIKYYNINISIDIKNISYENLVADIIDKMLNDPLMNADIDHVINNLPFYLNQQPQYINIQLREFCRQIYDQCNLNLLKKIRANIDIFGSQVSSGEYSKKLLELKKIFYGHNLIVADKVFIKGLELMLPFFINPEKFEVGEIDNFICTDNYSEDKLVKSERVIDSRKHSGSFLTYKINDDKTAVIFYFKESILTISNKSQFLEATSRLRNEKQIKDADLYDMIGNVITVVQWQDDKTIKFAAKQIKLPMHEEQVNEEEKSLKNLIKSSKSKLIEFISNTNLNIIDQEFFNKENNQKALAKINQLSVEQRIQVINFHQKYFGLRAEKENQLLLAIEIYGWQHKELQQISKSYQNVNLGEMQHEDLKHVINIFVENKLLEPKFINEFIVNFVNFPIKISNNNILIVKNKGKDKVEESAIIENKNITYNNFDEKHKKLVQEQKDLQLLEAIKASKQEYEKEQKKSFESNEGGSSSSDGFHEIEEAKVICRKPSVARRLFEENDKLTLLEQDEAANYDPLLGKLNEQLLEEEQLKQAIELSLKFNQQSTNIEEFDQDNYALESKRDQPSAISNAEEPQQSLAGDLQHI